MLGSLRKPVGAGQALTAPGALACLAGAAPAPAGRLGVCGDALLFLFAPFVRRQKALAI